MTLSRHALFAALLLCAAPAAAQQRPVPNPEARALFDAGVAAADAGRYAEAVVAFERSYALRASPAVLHNLALAYRGMGRLRDAVDAFERYLQNPGARATPQELAQLRTEFDTARAEVPELRFVLEPAEVTVTVDGRAVTPGAAALPLDPGRHVIELRADDRVPQRLELELSRAQRRTVQATLLETPPDGRVQIESNVPGARILFDEHPVGQERASVNAAPGEHTVQLVAAGYRNVTRTVRIGRHGVVRVDVVLQRAGVPAWALGVGIGGAALVVVGVTVAVVLATRVPEPEPVVAGTHYWGMISFPVP